MARGQKGWLLEWACSPKYQIQDTLVGVLPPRWSRAKVEEYVRLIYVFRTRCFNDIARCSRQGELQECRPVWDQFGVSMFFGDDPAIMATLVSNLVVTVDVDAGIETIRWLRPPERRINPASGFPEHVGPAAPREHKRSLGALREIAPRRVDA